MTPETSTRIQALKERASLRPHGTRARYMGGCRCVPCRAANSRYSCANEAARRSGVTNPLVHSASVRSHIKALSRRGIGYKTVAEIAKVSRTIVAQIRAGHRPRIRQATANRILEVSAEAPIEALGDASLVSARETWRMLNELLERGYSKAQLAGWLGMQRPALQINKRRITVRTAMRVRQMYEDLKAGRLRRQ